MAKHGSGEYVRVRSEEQEAVMGAAAVRLVDDIEEATSRATAVKAEARMSAEAAIRTIEAKLRTAIQGTELRGLPNLLPDSPSGFYGVRLRGKPNEILPDDGRPVLCLDRLGRIVMAMRSDDRSLRPTVTVTAWPATDEDFKAEDLEGVLSALAGVLQQHLARITRSTQRYEQVADLSERVAQVIGPVYPQVLRKKSA